MTDAKTVGELLRCADALTLYAIERDTGMESGNREARNGRIRELLCGMTAFYGLPEGIPRAYDSRLEAARGCFANEVPGIRDQRNAVAVLSRYAADLERAGGDPRPELTRVRDQFEDMTAYLPWDARAIGLYEAREAVERTLTRLTARRSMVFTRVLVGPETGPAASDFVSGAVTDAEGVTATELFGEMREQYPEIAGWPALCTVWRGGYGRGVPEPASDLDLDIIRRAGDRFLDQPGVISCGGAYEMTVEAWPEQDQGPTMKL